MRKTSADARATGEADYQERLAEALGELLAVAWRREHGRLNDNAGPDPAGAALSRERTSERVQRTRTASASQHS